MNVVLAEIADKMLTIFEMWMFGTTLAVGLCCLVFLCRYWSLPLLCLTAFILWTAIEEAYCEGSFSSLISQELGEAWKCQYIMSATLPTFGLLAGCVVGNRMFRSSSRMNKRLPSPSDVEVTTGIAGIELSKFL